MKKNIIDFFKNKLNSAIVIAIALIVLFYLLMPLWVGFNVSFVVLSAILCFLFATKLIIKSKSLNFNNGDEKKIKSAKNELIFFAVLLIFLGAYILYQLLLGA